MSPRLDQIAAEALHPFDEAVVRDGLAYDWRESSQRAPVPRTAEAAVFPSSPTPFFITRSGERLTLTTMEFKLLRFLVQNAGRVISRDELLNEVWGYDNYPCTRTVDNHILRLRQKLELDPARPVHFHTVHGVGYKFVLEASRVLAEHSIY